MARRAAHLWFSAQGRPARRGNNVRLLMDGEEAWSTVAADLRATRTSAHVATWWWESDFELQRDAATHPSSTEASRRGNTILSILEGSPAQKRVLVGQFLNMDGLASTLSSDAALRAHGTARGDRFEYMGQANPSRGMFRWQIPSFRFGARVQGVYGTGGLSFDADPFIDSEVAPRDVDLTQWPLTIDLLHASYHQKFMVLDDRVAFIGGMNLRRVDWDTSQHLVFEPRRMLFGSTTAQRQAVVAREEQPDNGPRKDYMVRVEGPSVRDAEDIFHQRWRYLIDTRADYSDDATDFAVPPPAAPLSGGVQAQVTATLPAPFNENAIAETLFNAVEQARQYIYIEDQYFRVPMLTDAIYRRMEEVPGLRLVVITKPINEWTDPGCAWTYRTHQQFRARFAGRYTLLQLRAFDTQVTWGFDETESRFVDMDTHSKIMMVDDVFLSVGSANKNNRGLIYEGELNVAVYDATWVRAARRRVIANLLGATTVSDDPAAWWAAIADAVRWNDAVRARWSDEGDDISLDGAPLPSQYRPRGFLYTLDPGPPSDCLIESIGPDVV
ncbi:MAG: phospholipase D-like domain-containing protein [Polyangiales bacterium]